MLLVEIQTIPNPDLLHLLPEGKREQAALLPFFSKIISFAWMEDHSIKFARVGDVIGTVEVTEYQIVRSILYRLNGLKGNPTASHPPYINWGAFWDFSMIKAASLRYKFMDTSIHLTPQLIDSKPWDFTIYDVNKYQNRLRLYEAYQGAFYSNPAKFSPSDKDGSIIPTLWEKIETDPDPQPAIAELKHHAVSNVFMAGRLYNAQQGIEHLGPKIDFPFTDWDGA